MYVVVFVRFECFTDKLLLAQPRTGYKAIRLAAVCVAAAAFAQLSRTGMRASLLIFVAFCPVIIPRRDVRHRGLCITYPAILPIRGKVVFE